MLLLYSELKSNRERENDVGVCIFEGRKGVG
jgi:hypothetical protein